MCMCQDKADILRNYIISKFWAICGNKMPPKGTRKCKNTSESEEQWKQREEKEKTEQLKMQLIELVREHPVLYDTAHPDHLNSSITDVIWEEIADNLGVDGKEFY